MFKIATIHISGVEARVVDVKPVTMGITGAVVEFIYDDPAWSGLNKHVVFDSADTVAVANAADMVVIPVEVTGKPNTLLRVGVYGVDSDGVTIIPTVWADLGPVRASAYGSFPPPAEQQLPVWAQILNMIGNLGNLETETKENLVAAVNEVLAAVGNIDLTDYAKREELPAKTSQLTNDSGFITNAVLDLVNYYSKSETYTRVQIDEKLSTIPKFTLKPVAVLPTEEISETTIYLLKAGNDSGDLYTEYIFIDGEWEILGSQRVDLSGYVKTVNGKAPDAAGNVEVDSSQNVTLTAAQIAALDSMFKVCAFVKDDVSAEYAAFQTAFGLTDSGDGGEDSGGSEDTHTHAYTATVTTAATCTTAGVRTYTCSCGDSYTESIPATGHNYVDGVCSVCGAADPSYSEDVTLASISATYSGGNVEVGTAVADLTGIVVTAHYSDSSTETVSGYTLSGEIAEGENTITVSYGGKTTTFTVKGVAESGGEDSDGPTNVDTWDYEWNCADGVPMTESGWKQFTAYTGFVTSFDASTGQKLAIVEPANTSVFGGLILSDYPTATAAICEAVFNFDRVDQGQFMMSLSDGTNMAAWQRDGGKMRYNNMNTSAAVFEPGVDYTIRIEYGADGYSIFLNGTQMYTADTMVNLGGDWHKWGNSVKTAMLCVQNPECAVNIKSYKYKVVTA